MRASIPQEMRNRLRLRSFFSPAMGQSLGRPNIVGGLEPGAAPAPPGSANRAPSADAPRPAEEAPRTRPLVLVIDDQRMQRLILREALEGDGFAVLEAENGIDGLSFFERFSPDVVLLDVRMPGMDGFAVCSALRAMHSGSHVPILVLTVLGDQESIDRAFQAGATDFITKPMVWSILGRRLRYMLKASSAFQDLAHSEAVLAKSVEERTRLLDEANRNLALANRELEAFSYSASHDLRAPLRAIDGYVKLLLQDGEPALPPSIGDPLHRIQAACERMSHLIEDLLELSSVTRHEIRRQNVDLSALANEVADNLRDAHPGRSVEIVVTPGMQVLADPGLMRIAMDNLVSNAFKFTNATSAAKIEIGKLPPQQGGDYFVRDNGAGFKSRSADKLFRPFQRLHSQSEFEGTGIGLTIVARIFNRHGGKIRAEGEPNKGATFYFTLG